MRFAKLMAAAAVLVPLCLASAATAQTPQSAVRPAKAAAPEAAIARASTASAVPVPTVHGKTRAPAVAQLRGAPGAASADPSTATMAPAGLPSTDSSRPTWVSPRRFGGPTSSLDGVVPTLNAPTTALHSGDWLPQVLRDLRLEARGLRSPGSRSSGSERPGGKEQGAGARR